MINFKNKKILITGSTGGIGAALVKKFISLGGKVLATGTKSEKLDVFEAVYDLNPYDRYDGGDPELFMGHGTARDLVTPYTEALELQGVYESLGIYNKLVTLLQPNGDPAGHGAWNAIVGGKSLSELTFDFLVERQNLNVE